MSQLDKKTATLQRQWCGGQAVFSWQKWEGRGRSTQKSVPKPGSPLPEIGLADVKNSPILAPNR